MVKSLLKVIAPAPVRVVVAWPTPLPKVKLLNIQPESPPKLPEPSRVKVPPDKLIRPLPIALPPLTVMSTVPDKVPIVIVRLLFMVVEVDKVQPPPEPLKTKLSKVEALLLIEKPVEVAVKVVVWLTPWEKLPKLIQSLPQKILLASMLKVEPVAILISPPIADEGRPDSVVTEPPG